MRAWTLKAWTQPAERTLFEHTRAATAALLWLALGCNGDKSDAASNALFEAPSNDPGELFGGEPEQPAPSAAASPCDVAHPSPDNLRIDDFEDGDAQIHRVFERDGWWWVTADETPGSLIPERGAERPVALPEGGGLGMHFAAQGFTQWGAVLGMSLEWAGEGVTCAFNAGAYAGFSFRAKGTGSLPVQVALPETSGRGEDTRAKCVESCWDHYQVIRQLTPDWTRHEIRWNDLQQGGWGKAVPFNAERLLGIFFSPTPEDLPVDVWIDDVEFIPR